MFSGFVTKMAEVISYNNQTLTLRSNLHPSIGDSIAVNGACLSVIFSDAHSFSLELSETSAKLLAIENYTNLVHIEEALKLSDGLHGHIVQGHIDFIGIVENIKKGQKEHIVTIKTNIQARNLIINKGSICIDGISLTICNDESKITQNDIYFQIAIIPHTFENTLFKTYKPGRRVNIETDIINRSIYKILQKMNAKIDGANAKMQNISQDLLDSISLSY